MRSLRAFHCNQQVFKLLLQYYSNLFCLKKNKKEHENNRTPFCYFRAHQDSLLYDKLLISHFRAVDPAAPAGEFFFIFGHDIAFIIAAVKVEADICQEKAIFGKAS
jgi:hypothetical protein